MSRFYPAAYVPCYSCLQVNMSFKLNTLKGYSLKYYTKLCSDSMQENLLYNQIVGKCLWETLLVHMCFDHENPKYLKIIICK